MNTELWQKVAIRVEVLLSGECNTLAVDRKRETAEGHVTYWKCSNRKTDCKAQVI